MLREQKFDLIFVHCSSVAHYVDRVRGIPKILDFGDMDSQKWLEYVAAQAVAAVLGLLVGGPARAGRRKAPRAALRPVHGDHARRARTRSTATRTGTPSDWFPNGVDSALLRTGDPSRTTPTLIAFVGRMDYFPNQQCMLDFCADVLPLMQGAGGRR